jgi:hypothetical protein
MRPMSQNLNKESRAKAARLSSRFICPRPPLRNFTKEMGLFEVQRQESKKALRHRWVTEGLQPISSEPAPSHRPWASVPGATPKRTSVEHGISCPTRTRIATEASAPDAETPVSSKPATRSLPNEDLGIPRQLVDRRCGANPAAAILDVPAWGATPRRSFSDYDKEEKPGAFGYFLT